MSDPPGHRLPARNPVSVHPLTLAVIRHKLLAVAEEVVETMVRTCFSPLLNQSRDFSAVVLDADAQVVAQAERVPIHMGAMPFAVRAMANAFAGDIAEGDVLMANDPYWGGSHLPDITLARPIFCNGRIRLWIANRAHQGDIGGLSAGGYAPEAREIWHEGVRVPPVKLVRWGVLGDDLLRLVCENTRKPDDIRGDIMAQLASVTVGAERLAALFARYGADQVGRASEAILDAGEAAMRAEIRRWKPGSYEGVSFLEDDGCGNRNVPIKAGITVGEGEIVVDLRDNPDQVRSFMNSPIANTAGAVNVAFMYLTADQQTQNEGSARAIRVLTRKGSIVDSKMPAPVTACTGYTAAAVIEAVIKAMEGAAPTQAFAGFARRFRFVIAGADRGGGSYIWHCFTNRGGAGANAAADGWNNLGSIHNPGASPSASVERTESAFPMFIETYEFVSDTAGAGARRGGTGALYVLRYEGNGPAVLNATGEGVRIAPYGLAGGRDGSSHDYAIETEAERAPLDPKAAGLELRPGARIVCRSAGGGGWGDPEARRRELVQRDLEYGFISEDSAREVYGL